MITKKPTYDLTEVHEIAKDIGRCHGSKRVSQWLKAHGYDESVTIQQVLLNLRHEDFYKSDPLKVIPGKMGDIYITSCKDEEWYVKFFIDGETGFLRLRVLSCCWDGVNH